MTRSMIIEMAYKMINANRQKLKKKDIEYLNEKIKEFLNG